MYSTFTVLFLLSGISAIFYFFRYISMQQALLKKIDSLNGIIDSLNKEISKKDNIIKNHQPTPHAENTSSARNKDIKVNLRSPNETQCTPITDTIFAEQISTLTNQLKEKEELISAKNLECSSLLLQLQTAIREISSLKAQRNTTPNTKVEHPDHNFLMQELGDKNKEISQLRSDIATLHQQIAQLKANQKEQEDAVQQLDYLRCMYPAIDEILSARPSSHPSESEHARDYLPPDDWNNLSDSQRNQLTLDRYVKSHNKTKWQIGRDYELYVAHKYRQQGYEVDPCGSYLKLEDMGRDLILRKGDQIRIVQCKYWASGKEINERFIFLLYGSVLSYCIENKLPQPLVKGIFVTNIKLTEMAKKCAKILDISIVESYPLGDFPRIKCNVKKDQNGEYVYIYHLPTDPQYDRVKIKDDRECYAYTIDEAESYGFRHADK